MKSIPAIHSAMAPIFCGDFVGDSSIRTKNKQGMINTSIVEAVAPVNKKMNLLDLVKALCMCL